MSKDVFFCVWGWKKKMAPAAGHFIYCFLLSSYYTISVFGGFGEGGTTLLAPTIIMIFVYFSNVKNKGKINVFYSVFYSVFYNVFLHCIFTLYFIVYFYSVFTIVFYTVYFIVYFSQCILKYIFVVYFIMYFLQCLLQCIP